MVDLKQRDEELRESKAMLARAREAAEAASEDNANTRAAAAEVEDLRRRLKNGQARAEEELQGVLREFEVLKASADEAAVNGRARIKSAEEEAARLREQLDASRHLVARAEDAEAELAETRRDAAAAKENGTARIKAGEAALEAANAEVEDMKLRLRNGQARADEALEKATARADDAERRLEETRRQASLAAETGAARVAALEEEVELGRDAFVEIKRLERIIEGEGSTGAKRLLAAELEDVKRQAALAAEKGGARIRDAEAELERVRAELARMAAERGGENGSGDARTSGRFSDDASGEPTRSRRSWRT